MNRSMQQRARARRNQRGVALIICLFALILLTSIALGMISMTDIETRINRNFRTSQQAYLAANAGLEHVRSQLAPGGAITPPTALPGAGPSTVVYYINRKAAGENIDPLDPSNRWYDTELCHENYTALGLVNPGANIPCPLATPPSIGWWSYHTSNAPGNGSGGALEFKWVRLNLKTNSTHAPSYYVDGGVGLPGSADTQVCWDGTRELLRPPGYTACDAPFPNYKPVVIITAVAEGSKRMAQMEVAQDPPIFVEAPVASYDHVTLNGALQVNGYDYCSCMKDGSGNWVSRPGKMCDNTKWGIYSHSTVDHLTGNSGSIVSAQIPPVAQNMPWNHDVEELIDMYKNSSGVKDVRNAPYGWTCTGTPLNCGTRSDSRFGVPPTLPPNPPDNPLGPSNMAAQYTYIPGDLQITGGSVGNGVLIVDGDLDIHGGLEFYGLILVKGVVRFTGGGSNPTNIYGALLAGHQSIDEITSENLVLGGSANVKYDFCALLNSRPPQPPTILGFHELMY